MLASADSTCSQAWHFASSVSAFPFEAGHVLGARLASHLFPLYFTDSPASASREIAFFFPEFNEQLWYQQEEPRLRCGQMYYNAEKRVHCVIRGEETELT